WLALVLAGDRLLRRVRVTDDVDPDPGGPADAQLLAAGQVLDPVAAAGAVDHEEGDVVIGVAGRLPCARREDRAGEPHAVGRHPAAVTGHEGDPAGRLPADAVGSGDDQIAGRAVHHARGAEVLA